MESNIIENNMSDRMIRAQQAANVTTFSFKNNYKIIKKQNLY